MAVHNRRLKLITFTLGATEFQCQVNTWNLDPGIEDGERQYTFCADGEFIEDTEPESTLEVRFFSDWREGGISDFLWEHNGEEADFVIDHHPNITGEHVRWTGKLKVKPGPVGGEKNTTEATEVTFQCIGLPVYSRVG